jgi:hypothetical protein
VLVRPPARDYQIDQYRHVAARRRPVPPGRLHAEDPAVKDELTNLQRGFTTLTTIPVKPAAG